MSAFVEFRLQDYGPVKGCLAQVSLVWFYWNFCSKHVLPTSLQLQDIMEILAKEELTLA